VTRSVLAVVSDLFFATKIAATAEAAGVPLETLDPAAALDRFGATPSAARASESAFEIPALVLLDLAAGEPALAVARALRGSAAGARITIAGFFPHVDVATREAAIAAGVDPVLPRSAFVARLPALLAGVLAAHPER